jgi:hypothetical protein
LKSIQRLSTFTYPTNNFNSLNFIWTNFRIHYGVIIGCNILHLPKKFIACLKKFFACLNYKKKHNPKIHVCMSKNKFCMPRKKIACLKIGFACRNYACLKEFFFMPLKSFACLKKNCMPKKNLHAWKKVLHALIFFCRPKTKFCMPKKSGLQNKNLEIYYSPRHVSLFLSKSVIFS